MAKKYSIKEINDGKEFELPEYCLKDVDEYSKAKLSVLREHKELLGDATIKGEILLMAEKEGNIAFLASVLKRVDKNVTIDLLKKISPITVEEMLDELLERVKGGERPNP